MKLSSKLKKNILKITVFCFNICDQIIALVPATTGNQPQTDLSGFTCQAEWEAENRSN